jgi:hypothetical protein
MKKKELNHLKTYELFGSFFKREPRDVEHMIDDLVSEFESYSTINRDKRFKDLIGCLESMSESMSELNSLYSKLNKIEMYNSYMHSIKSRLFNMLKKVNDVKSSKSIDAFYFNKFKLAKAKILSFYKEIK